MTADPEPAAERPHRFLYVALGDSTVEGIGASAPDQSYVGQLHQRLREVRPDAEMINLGVNGATSADVLHEQLPHAIALQPQLVTISVGPNDLTDEVEIAEYQRNLEAILTALREKTGARVVITLFPDLGLAPIFTDDQRAGISFMTVIYNTSIQEIARRNGASVVDLYRPGQVEIPEQPDLISADGYHPSDSGYARWAEVMWPVVQEAIRDLM